MTAWRAIPHRKVEGLAAEMSRDERHAMLTRRVAIGLLAATVLFNPVLALVNAHLHRIGSGAVAGVQALIVVAALALGMAVRPRALGWLALAWGLVLSGFLFAVLRGALDPKAFADALLVPAFICLGAALDDRSMIRLTAVLQTIIVAIGLWEVLNPVSYGHVFKVLDYYVATRGYNPSQFFAGGDLFVSASRGGGRYLLAFTHWHRASSVFLEPVSLGNWAGVIALFLAAYWDRFTWAVRGLWALSIAATLVLCDGRLGLGVCVLLAVAMPLVRRVPGWVSVAYLPVFILLLDGLVALGLLKQTGDTLSGRLRGGIDLLNSMDVAQLFTLGDISHAALDAGWVYLVETQSILAALAIWGAVTLTRIGETRSARAAKHGIAIFVLLSMPISYAIFSVKTSALMWALYGCFFQAARRSAPDSEPAAMPATLGWTIA